MATSSLPQTVPSQTGAASSQAAAQPRQAGVGPGGPGSGTAESARGSTHLVAGGNARASEVLASAVDPLGEHGALRLTPPQERLPVGLAVAVPVREFRVRHLLAMAPGELIETQWGHEEDVPLSAGDVQLAWTEFEVVDTRLAVRVTRLA